jgi:preprotein translocase subunit SecD
MYKNLRWKLLATVVVLAWFIGYGVYPILAQRYDLPIPAWLAAKRLKLGLDLQGGVHLVLRVQTDDALRLETETSSERLREELRTRNLVVGAINPTSITEFVVEGVPGDRDGEFHQIADEQVGTIFDRASGAGGRYTFRMKPNVEVRTRQDSVTQALETIERRVNALGVSEPIVAPHGSAGDQILVQLPGVTDVAHAKEIIRSTAMLELKIVEDGPAATREALLQNKGGVMPSDMEVVSGVDETSQDGRGTAFYLVRKVAAVTGKNLRIARPTLDENSRPAVAFTLNRDGGRQFANVTGANVGRRLAIILDNRVQLAPVIQERIPSGDVRITGGTGGFTQQQVSDYVLLLKSGALPASLTYLEERSVGPTLGADSIRAGVMASIGGLALVTIFMLLYYKLAGINAMLTVALNLVILLGFMANVEAVMTLPGIAGFILTIGMGVDSNVLIFERIKEELATLKGVRQAVAAGFDRVFLTILDTHVSSLIAAGFLFQFGTGPIRGFATTLFFGLLSNVFTSVFVSRTLFETVLSRRAVAKLSI